jgi:hypothetical protein
MLGRSSAEIGIRMFFSGGIEERISRAMHRALGRALIYRGGGPPAQRQPAPGGLGAMFDSADLLC